ncbi:MAG: DUF2868 domain-containing protein [Gammaproteobacteria bacterium]|jgi:hypothetical protein
MSETAPTTLLEDAIDIPIWLEADASTPLRQRNQRDREIASKLVAADDVERVRSWWRRLGGDHDALPGRGVARARAWVSLGLVLIGFMAGAGLALAAFRYDGTFPVNVVRVLALLVAPQVVLVALGLLLIPGRMPGLGFVQDTLAAINPGALAAALYGQLTQRPEARVFGRVSAPSAAARRFARWQMLHWSQMTAVAFNLAVIATAAGLIAFTDLAFGWSTTLDIASETAARVFGAIAAPWALIFPQAVPDPVLVSQSQFFRLEGSGALPDSRALTGWWSFVLLAVIVYGLLPRLVFVILTGSRLRAAMRALLLEDFRVTALLDRMSAPAVETRGASHDEARAPGGRAAGAVPAAELHGSASAVIWSQALDAARAGEFAGARLGLSLSCVAEAGCGSLEADREALERLGGTQGPVVVFTPAWEPPLLEFSDFLAALRVSIGVARSIVVVPVGESRDEPAPRDSDNWRLAVGRLGDPHAYVETGGQ